MSENEQKTQQDYDGLKETISAIKEARKNAKENPADKGTVLGFRKKTTFPPNPIRKRKIKMNKKGKKDNATVATKCGFYKSAFLEGYKNFTALGLEERVIERLFGIGHGYFANKFNEGQDEELQKSYQEAMDKLQAMLSKYMLVKAMGYEYEEEKITYCKKDIIRQKKIEDGSGIDHTAKYNKQHIGSGRWMAYRKEVMKKHQPGSDQLFIFFMTNRFPDKWKISRELLTGKAEGYDSKPSERIRKVIESLGRDVLEQNTDRPEAEPDISGGLTPISGGSDKDSQK